MPTNREARQWDKVQDMALLRQIAANRRLAVARYLAAKAALPPASVLSTKTDFYRRTT
jgi:hypothetical protein